tara:strand:+ start:929 stop:1822 length:894 start_codon:yes stop_codon:yes gene_type:complete
MAVTINGTTGIAGASWTTSGRPASPVSGQQGYNTTLKALEVYINASWRIMAEGFTATGGTITTDGSYTVHSFTSSGTFTPSSAGTVEYLVVAGGGGRGKEAYYGGGGGAGGFLTATDFAVAATGLTVTIGAGGAESLNGTGADGSDSVFSSITADGGGGGAFPDQVGNNGGSGGGGGGNDSARAGGSATAGQGNDGGASQTSGASAAGGGGGAGGVGGTSTGASLGTGGVGGAGLQSSINGTATYYSAGGGGVNGYTSPADGANGTGWANAANLGHGGGAVTNGNGSSGIVIIRYLT